MTRSQWTFVGVSLVACAVAAFMAGKSSAAGIPSSGALTYSGLLQDGGGNPLAGTQFVEVRLWNHASASAAANLLCDTGTPASVALTGGHFSLGLPDKCTSAVAANPDAYTEVLVGASASTAVSLGRAKLGAVPFAVTATSATQAASARLADVAAAAKALNVTVGKAFGATQPPAGTAFQTQAGTTTATIGSDGRARVAFPARFPNGLLTVLATDSFAANQFVHGLDDDEDTTGFTVLGVPGHLVRVNWIAIGW